MEFDLAVGALVDAVRKRGLLKRTMFVVTSDNGPQCTLAPPRQKTRRRGAGRCPAYVRDESFARVVSQEGTITKANVMRRIGRSDRPFPPHVEHRSAGPFRGYKGTPFEGGLRVPLVISWADEAGQGPIPSGRRTGALVTHMDLVRTIAEIGAARGSAPGPSRLPRGATSFAQDAIDLRHLLFRWPGRGPRRKAVLLQSGGAQGLKYVARVGAEKVVLAATRGRCAAGGHGAMAAPKGCGRALRRENLFHLARDPGARGPPSHMQRLVPGEGAASRGLCPCHAPGQRGPARGGGCG